MFHFMPMSNPSCIQLAIRTIFPDGFNFEGNQCRTRCIDEVLRYSLLLENGYVTVFAGKQAEILKKSLWLDPAGQKPNTLDPDLIK